MPTRLAPAEWPQRKILFGSPPYFAAFFATQASASIVQALLADPRCAFEIAGETPPYHGVRGRARVTVAPDEDLAVLRSLVTRYLGSAGGTFARWLLGRDTPEVVLRLDPVELSSWDYRARMAPGAGA